MAGVGEREEPVTANQVRALRKRLKLTQAALATRLGVTTKAVAHWEQGRRRIQRTTILLLTELTRGDDGIGELSLNGVPRYSA